MHFVNIAKFLALLCCLFISYACKSTALSPSNSPVQPDATSVQSPPVTQPEPLPSTTSGTQMKKETKPAITKERKKKCGGASFYSESFAGSDTASGEPYNPNAMTAAMLEVPFGRTVSVVSQLDPSKEIKVRITDRGPYSKGRIIDLSRVAFKKMAPLSAGVTKVCVYWN